MSLMAERVICGSVYRSAENTKIGKLDGRAVELLDKEDPQLEKIGSAALSVLKGLGDLFCFLGICLWETLKCFCAVEYCLYID